MEKISNSLKDLYEDVNTRKFLRIKSKWKEMLSNVGDSNCKKLLQLAESKSEDGVGQFSLDGTITLNKYINSQVRNAMQVKTGSPGGNASQIKTGSPGGNTNQTKTSNPGGNAKQDIGMLNGD